MAVYTLPVGVDRINVSKGGSTFTKNSSGYIIRQNKKGLTTNTHFLTVRRTNFLHLVRYWSGLSAYDKSTWNVQAGIVSFTNSLGNIYFLSGFQLFVKRNTIRLNQSLPVMNQSVIQVPQPNFLITNVLVDIDPVDIDIFTNISPVPANFEFRFWTTVFSGFAINNKWPDRYRIVKTFSAGATSPFTLGPSYINRWGSGPQIEFTNKQKWSVLISLESYQVNTNQSIISNTMKASIIQ